MKYSEKLKDPRWQKVRLKVLERDGWACRVCGETTKTLHVHHLQYEKGRAPWDYPIDWLLVLCEDHHPTKDEQKPLWWMRVEHIVAEWVTNNSAEGMRVLADHWKENHATDAQKDELIALLGPSERETLKGTNA